jgi:hypothetical protein
MYDTATTSAGSATSATIPTRESIISALASVYENRGGGTYDEVAKEVVKTGAPSRNPVKRLHRQAIEYGVEESAFEREQIHAAACGVGNQ